ncbi:MTHFR-domain-containing protein [Rickenella mellea]|uniref:MTHFR-domain-containing protein n=1 Tax=Rickenella mellea TaxID=50990 RepID=A0A4Y7QD24_9AGAM|nr:MTHFR-domain-containing protein [Rickenella mellea]
MKLSEKIRHSERSRPFFTFEFFPPRTDQGFANLLARISRLASLDPLAINVTWGAGGSTKDRSLDLAGIAQSEYGIDTVLHLTCTNMVQGSVDAALRDAKERGIHNILALRGDPPRGEEYWIPTDPRFTHAIDLVKYIKSSPEFSDFCVGVAAYPDGHADRETDEDGEIKYLKAKVDAGADFIVTQLFYDVDGFLRWLSKVRETGIGVPIIPGIMPLQNYGSFLRLTKLCGTRVPVELQAALEPIRHDDQMIKDYGVSLATTMVKRLVSEGGIEGVHFCTLNLERSVQRVLEDLNWIGGSHDIHNRLIAETPGSIIHAPHPESDLIITPIDASNTAKTKLETKPVKEIEEPGRGEANNEATWDEFPNGRFGDFKSPAYGIQDPWNPGHYVSRNEGLSTWGHPKTIEEVTGLFLSHLHGKVTSTPFSQSPLLPESLTILRQLEKMTKRGWWTVGSQPAVDGADSSDDVFGWGPRGGYVYQKGFVEFFADKADVDMIEERVKRQGGGWVDFLAGNVDGECKTNMSDDGRNAVTWGVFPGREVAQSTIIERDSFLAWKDEVFTIWSQWALFYPPDSKERQLLESICRERWLVSVVHHDFKKDSALWSFLLSEE